MNKRNMYANNGLDLTDYGPEPFVANLNKAARQNCNFRTALWTGNHFQMTLMSISAGEELGLESHPHLDQLLRVEDGYALVKMGGTADKLNYQKDVYEGFAVFIPAGTWHNVINTGNKPVKLSSVYAPPQHPHGTVEPTKPEDEHDEPAKSEEPEKVEAPAVSAPPPPEYIDYTE